MPRDDRVLVGMDRPDDAGVYLVRDDLALVLTVDVISPIADDPRDFGRIAAANALSDVYAMGGRPVAALDIVCFPVKSEPPETFREMLRGGIEVLAGAGAALVGGHSVDDPELKLGFQVTGVVDPRRMLTKGGARPGDVLVLTKPLGTGLVSTAMKRKAASPEAIRAAIASMVTLNRAASEAALAHGVVACTDVTGFGLVGHLREVVLASGVGVDLDVAAVPALPFARDYAAAGLSPGGTKRNRDFAGCLVDGLDSLPPDDAALLFDPQNSGGLLMAVPPGEVDSLLRRLVSDGVRAAVIGRFGGDPRIRPSIRPVIQSPR